MAITQFVSNETVFVLIGYFIVYFLILNGGKNIHPLRRIIGATCMIGMGYASLIILGEVDENIIGIAILMFTVIYFFIQLEVAIRHLREEDE
jgi:hypothetical protein